MRGSKRWGDEERVLAAATRYARTGVRSTHEVLTFLRQRGVSPAAARRAVAACQARGALDDLACARLWADHLARKGYAWSVIHLKLSAKGLDEHTIEEAADRLDAARDDDARARVVAASYLRRQGTSPRHRAGAARTLASRGFDPDLIERVLDDTVGPIPSDAER